MAKHQHVEIVRRGKVAIQEWRAVNVDTRLDLRGAGLGRVDLRSADLGAAILHGADLSQANLHSANLAATDMRSSILSAANLNSADLRDADLSAASLHSATLCSADLSRANLQAAHLPFANLSGARLSEANLRDASCRATVFADVDLSTTKALETIRHVGPSTIGIDTLMKSRGNIPASFLCGAGVPEEMVDYLPTLLGALEPIQFYSCFISYSSADEAFTRSIHSRLRDEKLRVWYAPEDLKGGRELFPQVDEAIRVHDKVLLVLSEASLGSEWVRTEVRRACDREKRENRRVLFPIRLLPFERLQGWTLLALDGEDLAARIRRDYIPEFSNWKDQDAFEKEFSHLVRDLRSDDDRAAQPAMGDD